MSMNIRTQIDPRAISFQQLKALTACTTGKAIPDADTLAASRAVPLFQYDSGNTVLTMYRNGFCLCQSDSGASVIAIDRCRKISYKTPDGEIVCVDEAIFSDGPCLIPLLMASDVQRERSVEDYAVYWQDFSSA